MARRTKIVATLGPANGDARGIRGLIEAGVNVFRLNFSHGDASEHQERAQTIRDIAAETKTPIGILCDMQGPKIRIGSFVDSMKIDLQNGGLFCLDSTLALNGGTAERVHIEQPYIDDVKNHDRLLLDDGRIELNVIEKSATSLTCRVTSGGILSSKKGINKFGGGLSADALTDKDRSDIKIAAALNTDYLAISFVRSKSDVETARQLLKEAGGNAHVIAKIERAEAITEAFLPGIIEASDGLMVARGDLGVEIGDENLMAVQKQLIDDANHANRVVITATQMMESMIHSPVPTRAEVFDVANAVLDGTDAVMLSAETAVGDYPIETVRAMARVIEGAEKYPLAQRSKHRIDETFQRIDESIALATMYVANHLEDVAAIICMTETGVTPLIMSRINSHMPIYAMAQKPSTCAVTALYKGVIPIPFQTTALKPAEINPRAIAELVARNAVVEGDLVLITRGDIVNLEGGTNSLRIVRVEATNL